MTILQRVLSTILMAVFMGSAWAAPAETSASTVAPAQTITPAAIKNELLDALRADGVLNNDQRISLGAKFITPADNARFEAYSENTSWTRHLTWSLVLKCFGLGMLFVATWGLLRKIPNILYQTVLLGISLAGLLVPERIYPAHAFDLALFCAFTTPVLMAWLIITHQRLLSFFEYILFTGTFARYFTRTLGLVYFLSLALSLDSQILGVAAMWFIVSIPALMLVPLSKHLFEDTDTQNMVSLLFAHLLVALVWVMFTPGHSNTVPNVLGVAATYYLPVVINLLLFVTMSPLYWFNHKNSIVFYVAMYIVLVGASFSNIFAPIPAMNSLLVLTGIATILFWVLDRSFRVGFLLGAMVTGTTLYVLSLNIDAIRAWLNTLHFAA